MSGYCFFFYEEMLKRVKMRKKMEKIGYGDDGRDDEISFLLFEFSFSFRWCLIEYGGLW